MSSWRQLDLHPRIISALHKAGVRSVRDALRMSGPDLQRLTSLSASDVRRLLAAAALLCRPRRPLPVLVADESELRLSLGCPLLDGLLRGGLPVGAVTELSGESGVGKTQLALQLCLSVQYPARHGGLDSGAVFVCTEDVFPSRRLQQLISEQRRLRVDVPADVTSGLRLGDRVYVEHAADLMSLQSCLRRRVRLLLARRLVRFVAVDSVASLFRSEFGLADWLEKSKQLLTLSATLHHLCQQFNSAVLCVNQVTDIFSGSEQYLGYREGWTARLLQTFVNTRGSATLNEVKSFAVDSLVSASPSSSTVCPALGLAWANQVMVRLMMRRLQGTVSKGEQDSALRRLEVVFAPHLARAGLDVAVWKEGVRGLDDERGQDGVRGQVGVRGLRGERGLDFDTSHLTS